eukprot:118829-Pyramimonas_sp.AAC.1
MGKVRLPGSSDARAGPARVSDRPEGGSPCLVRRPKPLELWRQLEIKRKEKHQEARGGQRKGS